MEHQVNCKGNRQTKWQVMANCIYNVRPYVNEVCLVSLVGSTQIHVDIKNYALPSCWSTGPGSFVGGGGFRPWNN